MTKKNFDAAVEKTVRKQESLAQNQFDTAEGILLNAHALNSKKSAPKKSAVERPMFSMLPGDVTLIESLRAVAANGGRHSTTKSEIVRVALQFLTTVEPVRLAGMLEQLQKVPRHS